LEFYLRYGVNHALFAAVELVEIRLLEAAHSGKHDRRKALDYNVKARNGSVERSAESGQVVLRIRQLAWKFESGSLDARRDRDTVEICVGQFMAMAGLSTR
jgi:hypothetical protein